VSKDTWDIKLIDFGLAKELKPGKTIKTMQGTPEFVGKFTMMTSFYLFV
jgi:serine/threonine protein kinase